MKDTVWPERLLSGCSIMAGTDEGISTEASERSDQPYTFLALTLNLYSWPATRELIEWESTLPSTSLMLVVPVFASQKSS